MNKELITNLLAAYGLYKLYTSITKGQPMENELKSAVDFVNNNGDNNLLASLDLSKLTAIALGLFAAQQLVKK